jgi:D-galactarolactone cycloisomerase
VHPKDSWQREAATLVESGFTAMKVRMGLYPIDEELRAMTELRACLAPNVRIMVDAWGAYTLREALTVGRGLQDLGVVWFEEPASPYGFYAGYEMLAEALDIPVAGGEMGRTLGEFKVLFDRRALDVVQPDLAICGGLPALSAVAELSRLYGIPCVPHSWNGGVMAAATLQVIATLPSVSQLDRPSELTCEYDTTENRFIRDIIVNPPQLVDGGFAIPTAPGLGIEVDEEVVRRYAVA